MKKTRIHNIGYSIFRPLCKLFILIVCFPKVVHKENVPKKGGFILAGTHVSKFDPFFVGSVTIRPIHYLAKKELLDVPIVGKILRFMGVVRVDRSTSNPRAKKEAIDILQSESIICVFPEGTCNKTKEPLMPFKYGAVSFAYHSGKPIVPFAIIKKPRMFHYGSKIIIGKPFYVKSDNYEKENEKFRNIVLKLIKEGNRYGKKK